MASHSWRYLFSRYIENTITESELEQLLRIVDEQQDASDLRTILEERWRKTALSTDAGNDDWNEKLEELFNDAAGREAKSRSGERKYRFRPWIAAAVTVGVICAATLIYLTNHKKQQEPLAPSITLRHDHDVAAPAGTVAILTLANGKTVPLGSITAGMVVRQGSAKVEKLKDGQLVYSGSADASLSYNVLTVPRGSRVASITLADGTRVWLNAASSLKYPVAFAAKERRVFIVGEAYFEVAHNARLPFVVDNGNTHITVLGTHFNVNAYQDESMVKVTLMEGSVNIDRSGSSRTLSPGQQAVIGNSVEIRNDADLDEVLAWKNGRFSFGEAADINSVMREIARWYDVEVKFERPVVAHIGGTISRDENASQVFRMLEMTGAVKFQIDDRKVTVEPNVR